MNAFEQAQEILEIENDYDRRIAAVHWIRSHSSDEREKLLGNINDAFQRVCEVMVPMMDQLGVLGK